MDLPCGSWGEQADKVGHSVSCCGRGYLVMSARNNRANSVWRMGNSWAWAPGASGVVRRPPYRDRKE